MKPTARPAEPPLVSSWGALLLATLSATTVFVLALAVTAYVRRDDTASRSSASVSSLDGGASFVDTESMHDHGDALPRQSDVRDAGPSSARAGGEGTSRTEGPDAGTRTPAPAHAAETASVDVGALARATFAPIESTVVACVRDARRRDPAAGDEISFVIVIGRMGTVDALVVSRSPSPFATRCLLDAAALPEQATGALVNVDVSTRGGIFAITRVAAPRAP
jgi:hypothetical protein